MGKKMASPTMDLEVEKAATATMTMTESKRSPKKSNDTVAKSATIIIAISIRERNPPHVGTV